MMDQWSNKTFVLQAVQNDPDAIEHADDILKSDIEICTLALSQNGTTLRFMKNNIRDSFKLVGLAVSDKGMSYQYATDFVKNNSTIISWAVSQNAIALQFAPPWAKNNKKIAIKAVSNNGYAYAYISDFLKNDLSIALAAVKQYGLVLSILPKAMREHPAVVEQSLQSCSSAFRFIGPDLIRNLALVTRAVDLCAMNLFFVKAPYNCYKKIILSALNQNLRYWKFAGEVVRKDRSFNLYLLRRYPGLKKHLERKLYHDCQTYAPLLFIKSSKKQQSFLPEEIIELIHQHLFFSKNFREGTLALDKVLSEKSPLSK